MSQPRSSVVIEVQNLHKRYGDTAAVGDVSRKLPRGRPRKRDDALAVTEVRPDRARR